MESTSRNIDVTTQTDTLNLMCWYVWLLSVAMTWGTACQSPKVSPALSTISASPSTSATILLEEVCKVGTQVDLSSLEPAVGDAILGQAGVPTGGYLDSHPGFLRRWASCEELAQVVTLKLGEVRTLAGFPPLIALESLSLVDVLDGELAPLTAFTSLRSLRIGPEGLAFRAGRVARAGSLEALGQLVELESLVLVNGGFENIAFATHLSSLRILDLRENMISDLTPLTDLVDLEELRLGGNKITDLAPLGRLSQLRVLEIQRNPIETLTALAGTPVLEQLDASNTRVRDIQVLQGMMSLRDANFCGTPIVEVGTLNVAAQAVRRTLQARGANVMIDIKGCSCC